MNAGKKQIKLFEPLLEPYLRRKRIAQVLKHIPPGGIVVDVGCGHIPHLLVKIEHFINQGIGLDKRVSNKGNGKIKLIKCRLAKKIDLKDNFADCVTLLAVLEHLNHPQEVLSEVYRILKPGGMVLITTPSTLAKPVLEFLAFKLGIVSTIEIGEHKRYFWRKELAEILSDIGFKGINSQYFELGMNIFAKGRKPYRASVKK